MLPIHGIVAWSKLKPLHDAYVEAVSSYKERMNETGVTIAEVFSVLGRGAVLFEPVFYWNDALTNFHHRTHPDTLPELPSDGVDNPAARELVEEMKSSIIELMGRHGSAHLQIGKLYPFLNDRSPTNTSLLHEMKRTLDPHNIINPGALGLAPESTES